MTYNPIIYGITPEIEDFLVLNSPGSGMIQ